MQSTNEQQVSSIPGGWVRIVRDPSTYPVRGDETPIRKSADAIKLFQPLAEIEDVEHFWVACLDTQSRVTHLQVVTRGLLNATLAHPREVFRLAVIVSAAGIIVAHNHPSGDPTPSPEDRAFSRRLVAAGQILEIPVYDHLVVGSDGRFISMASEGIL